MREVVATIEKVMSPDERVIALDRVLANIDKSQIVPKNVEGIKADPPSIFFSTTPAVIVNIDSQPIWSPIKDNDLKFAVNTNWDLFQHEPTKTFYLRNDTSWLKATDVAGPGARGTLPDSFKKLPADENWKDVKANLPGKPIAAAAVPRVFVSSEPAELILLTGAPKYVPVAGTALVWVSNTESDVFRVGNSGAVYYLVAGRWFRRPTSRDRGRLRRLLCRKISSDSAGAPSLARARVGAGHRRGGRSSPDRTDSADGARQQERSKAPEVAFQGEAKLTASSRPRERAVNTDKDVFKVGELDHLCYQGVWFVGRRDRPWEVAESVPEAIYKIPAELTFSSRHLRDD